MAASNVTRYAKSGDVRIAYQVVGEGPLDLVFSPPPGEAIVPVAAAAGVFG
jgi:hypothetical protein